MKEINEIRRRVDAIDKELIALLSERGDLAAEIGEVKKAMKQKAFSPKRENEILSMVGRQETSLPREGLIAIYKEIISSCRRIQEPSRVCYLGPRGSFTHQAASRRFGSQAEYLAVENIEDVFTEVECGRCDYGTVPVESSLEGMVTRTLDMFIESNNKINSEILLPISQCLLSNEEIESIKVIYSHPQAIAQCRTWIKRNLPLAVIKEVSSTSEAARIAAKEKNASAIAGSMAGRIYKIGLVEEDIQDVRGIYTRFLVIARNPAERSGCDKTSIMFSIKDRVGALYEILKPFAAKKINLTKIESRPSRRGLGDYYFFVDFMGHEGDPGIREALEEMKKNCVFLKLLGSYPREELP